MFTKLKGQQGFTLIELMIVVAIIGILAAIAIPNFILYQLKSQQAEGRTNLAGVKTSEVAFSGEQGCYVGVAAAGYGSPAVSGTRSVGIPWPTSLIIPLGVPTVVPGGQPNHCVTALGVSLSPVVTFATIGFAPTGLVRYNYGVTTFAAPTTILAVPNGPSCTAPLPLAIAGTTVVPASGFSAITTSNLDGDAAAVPAYGGPAGVSWFTNNDIQGVTDCTPQVF